MTQAGRATGGHRGGSQLECNVDETLLLGWVTDDEHPEFVMRRKKVKNGEGGRTYALARTTVGNSQAIEESDTQIGRAASERAELDEVIRWLAQRGLLDGLTHRATVAAAKDRGATWSEDKLKAAKRMWRGMDEVDREILTGC